MPFQNHDLSVLSYAKGFTLWVYPTQDDEKTVESIGYFQSSENGLTTHDVVMVVFQQDMTTRLYVAVCDESRMITLKKTAEETKKPQFFPTDAPNHDTAAFSPISTAEIEVQIAKIKDWITPAIPADLGVIASSAMLMILKESEGKAETTEMAQAFVLSGLSVLAKLARDADKTEGGAS